MTGSREISSIAGEDAMVKCFIYNSSEMAYNSVTAGLEKTSPKSFNRKCRHEESHPLWNREERRRPATARIVSFFMFLELGPIESKFDWADWSYNAVMSTTALVPLSEYFDTVHRPDCDYVEGKLAERNVGEMSLGAAQARLLCPS